MSLLDVAKRAAAQAVPAAATAPTENPLEVAADEFANAKTAAARAEALEAFVELVKYRK